MRSSFFSRSALLILSFTVLPSASAITILVDYTYDSNNFFDTNTADGAAARIALESATSTISTWLDDSFNAIAVGTGSNTWTASFTNPGTGSSTSLVNSLNVAADTYIVYVGGRSLSGSTLGEGGTGGFSVGGTLDYVNNVVARGEAGALGAANTQTDFARWGGSLTFDNDGSTTWHFGLTTTGLESGEADFLSVAYHELFHAIGFGTSNSWNNLVSLNTFTGAASVALNGGVNVPLAPDNAHWLEGTTSTVYPTGGSQEVAMDPSILLGTRILPTALDVAALDDLGWEISPIPEPSTSFVLFPVLIALWLLRKGRQAAPASCLPTRV